jgi:hypothetical protein
MGVLAMGEQLLADQGQEGIFAPRAKKLVPQVSNKGGKSGVKGRGEVSLAYV